MKAPAAKLRKLKLLCQRRDKLAGELKAVNEIIAGIRRELEQLLKLANVPAGVTAQARVIPCASTPKPKRAKRKPARAM